MSREDGEALGRSRAPTHMQTMMDHSQWAISLEVLWVRISLQKMVSFWVLPFSNISRVARNTGLFPHTFLKNVQVEANFSDQSAWFQPPQKCVFIDDAPPQDFVGNTIEHLQTQQESEFLKMVGLPACGKTYWALMHMEAKPEGKLWSFGNDCRDRSDESGRMELDGKLC